MQSDFLLYAPVLTSRLQYVLDYIFVRRLGLQWQFTADAAYFQSSNAPIKVNYSATDREGQSIKIIPVGLLFASTIEAQVISLNRWKHTFVLFYNQPKGKIPFDIFSAVFYFLSRYEEYLPHQKDDHQRFPAQATLAYQYRFLQQPVVDEWIGQLREILLSLHAGLSIKNEITEWKMSVDVDLTWKYLHKTKRRLWAGRLKDICRFNIKGWRERNAVLKGLIPDPFDCFDWISDVYNRSILYFVLMKGDTPYDRNASADLPAFTEKLKTLSVDNEIGIHPSYFAISTDIIKPEAESLTNILQQSVKKSRMHYIKLSMPATYKSLLSLGIYEDYTMGFAEENGFRAGTSRPFYWFDLEKNESTPLLIYPFVFMDATSYFYIQSNEQATLEEIERLAVNVKNTQGVFTGIWHNYLIGDSLQYPGQKALFEKTVSRLDKIFGTKTSSEI